MTKVKRWCSKQWKNDPEESLEITGAAIPVTGPECQGLGSTVVSNGGSLSLVQWARVPLPSVSQAGSPQSTVASAVACRAMWAWLPPPRIQRTNPSESTTDTGPQPERAVEPRQKVTAGLSHWALGLTLTPWPGRQNIESKKTFCASRFNAVCLSRFGVTWNLSPLSSCLFLSSGMKMSVSCLSHDCVWEASNLFGLTGSQLERNLPWVSSVSDIVDI